jgi:hypothetical protein
MFNLTKTITPKPKPFPFQFFLGISPMLHVFAFPNPIKNLATNAHNKQKLAQFDCMGKIETMKVHTS